MGTCLKRGTQVAKNFVVREKIGQGQFAEVYSALDKSDEKKRVAIKVDKTKNVRTLGREIKILKDLQKYDRFCKLIRHGKLEDGRVFCVMQLLGSNLTKYKKHKGQSLQVKEIIHIAREILESIQEMHSLGYVHRDIKPGNCAIRKKRGDGLPQWTLLDFGLSRKLVNDDGVQLQERKDASFRGSVSYASINAHNDKDLSWRDDLWSWLYIVVDLLEGDLPWKPLACEHVSSTSSSSPIAMLKKECQTDPSLMFPRGSIYLPQIAQINEYIGKLSFADIPDYRYLKDILDSVTPSDVPESRKETKDNHVPIPDESDTLNKSCNGDGTIKRNHQTLSELITVLQEGGYSKEAHKIRQNLTSVSPSEMIAIFCEYMNILASSNRNDTDIAEIMNEVSRYLAYLAKDPQEVLSPVQQDSGFVQQ